MKKISILFFMVLFTFSLFAKELIIVKANGKVNRDGSVTYKYVEQRFDSNGQLYSLKCYNRGGETCPRVGTVTIGATGVPLDVIIHEVEIIIKRNLASGITYGRIQFENEGLSVYYKDASIPNDPQAVGPIPEDIEYHMTIYY